MQLVLVLPSTGKCSECLRCPLSGSAVGVSAALYRRVQLVFCCPISRRAVSVSAALNQGEQLVFLLSSIEKCRSYSCLSSSAVSVSAAIYRGVKLVLVPGGVTDACAVCKILHVIECAWGSSGFKLPTV